MYHLKKFGLKPCNQSNSAHMSWADVGLQEQDAEQCIKF